MEPVRLPRFKRSPDAASVRLTERDREILRHVHRHRFLRSDHLTSLLPGSRQQTLRRLQLLYHHGYLERPRCQIDYYQSGSRPIAYGLGNKGAALLKHELSIPFHRLDWGSKGKVTRLFLEHALLVSDVMVAVELACRNRPDIRLLTPDDLPTQPNRREPLQWKVDLGNGRRYGVIPDRVFGLEFTDRPRSRNQVWFCLEADRGTMPVTRSTLDQSSFHRKLLAYTVTWSQKLHRNGFRWSRFRVLTVTSDPARITTIQRAARSLHQGLGLFLFTDERALRKQGDLLALPWKTCREKQTTSLLD